MKYCQISLFTLLFFLSCRDKKLADSNPAYFDHVFNRADTIRDSQPKQALKFVDSAFNAFSEPGIKDLYRKYDFYSNTYSYFIGSANLALQYADSMVWIIRDHTNEKEYIADYANALFTKGNILLSEKDYSKAFECNYNACKAIEKTNDTCLLSTYTNTLATISFKELKYLDAVRYIKQMIRQMSACPDDHDKFKTMQGKLDDLGFAYSKEGMTDSAEHYYKEALDYLERNRHNYTDVQDHERFTDIAEAVVYGNLGDIYLKKGDKVTAEELYKKDILINSQKGYEHGDARCTEEKLVNLYLDEKRYPEAKEIMHQLRVSLDTANDNNAELKWYMLYLDYLEKTGQTSGEYQYMKRYLALKDSLEKAVPLPHIDLQEESRHIKVREDLVISEKKNEQKNGYLIILLCGSGVIVTVMVLLWRNWKQTKRLNDQISQQNNEMQLAVDSVTETQKDNTRMMQIVAHDLRNPIASMITITSLLLENEGLPADDKEMLVLMNESSRHAIEMISDLLNLNTTAEGMKKEPADIRLLLQYCVDLLQFKASEKKQRITLSSENATLIINREKIWRVISNLIVNAIKFSKEGSQINITAGRVDGSFRIVIQDHGIGIPDNIRNSIFDMFTSAKRLGTSGERSFGLGLAISRQIIEAHGGKIWFESKAGVGSSFYICLPLQ